MTREDAIIELKEDIALYMPKDWVEEIDRDTPDGRLITALEMAIKALEQEPKTDVPEMNVGKWIPVKFRPLTKEEQEEYPDYCYMADCLMPADGEEILITTRYGTVEKDEAGFDEGFYLDSGYDWETDVVAWMPLPKAYEEG